MQALPTGIAPIPAALIQFLELLFGVRQIGPSPGFQKPAEEAARKGSSRGDAIHPAAARRASRGLEEAEAEEELDGFVGGGSFGLILGFRFCLLLLDFFRVCRLLVPWRVRHQ